MTGCTSGGYDQFETSPEAIEQELRPAVCERRQTYGELDYRLALKTWNSFLWSEICETNAIFRPAGSHV